MNGVVMKMFKKFLMVAVAMGFSVSANAVTITNNSPMLVIVTGMHQDASAVGGWAKDQNGDIFVAPNSSVSVNSLRVSFCEAKPYTNQVGKTILTYSGKQYIKDQTEQTSATAGGCWLGSASFVGANDKVEIKESSAIADPAKQQPNRVYIPRFVDAAGKTYMSEWTLVTAGATLLSTKAN